MKKTAGEGADNMKILITLRTISGRVYCYNTEMDESDIEVLKGYVVADLTRKTYIHIDEDVSLATDQIESFKVEMQK